MSNLSKKTDSEKYVPLVDFFTREKTVSKIEQIWVIYGKGLDAKQQSKGGRFRNCRKPKNIFQRKK